LEKLHKYRLSEQDVYLRISGGLFIKDPAADLGIAAAIISSYENRLLPADTIFIGELGLSGQVRSVAFLESRLKEAIRLGYKRAVVPAGGSHNINNGIELYPLAALGDLIEFINKE
jgi:DNA repair protein RadA/Sms